MIVNKRHAVAVVLLTLGFILCYGTVGHAELHNVWTSVHTVKCIIGLLLWAAVIPVLGDADFAGADCADLNEDEQDGGVDR